jgi:hypothetical protein
MARHSPDEALSKNHATALLALYAPDAVLESPLVFSPDGDLRQLPSVSGWIS